MNQIEHKAMNRRERGFTLVELMVVVVIIGILAALVVPTFFKQADRANVTAAKGQINLLKTALGMYKMEFKHFPSTSEGLEALINNEREKFLDQDLIPLDPWGYPYIYVCPGTNGHDFEIVSYGADGAPGGTGYDADIFSYDLSDKGN